MLLLGIFRLFAWKTGTGSTNFCYALFTITLKFVCVGEKLFKMPNIWVIVLFVVAPSLTIADDRCQPGAYRFGENCYTYITSPQPFNRANETCYGRGGQLAIIKDHNTARFLRALHKKMTALGYWIGLTDRHSEGDWSYISDITRAIQKDGYRTSLLYQNWNIGEPNDAGRNQDCAVMRPELGLAWDDNSCTTKLLYICQYEGSSIHCQNENRFQENCFEFSRQRVNFTEAEQACMNRGGKLAEIKSSKEQQILEDRINKKETWWKLLTDQQMDQFGDWNYGAWIGVHKAAGKWLYVDGTEVDLPFWRSGQPSSSENTNCVLVSNEWMSDTCDKLYSSFCQFKDDFRPTMPPNDISTTTQMNNNSKITTSTIAIIIAATVIPIILLIAILAAVYHRFIKKAVEAKGNNQPLPPPVPRRDEMHPNFLESRNTSFYTASDGYLITQEPLYLLPRNDFNHVYTDIMTNNDNLYASVYETGFIPHMK